MIERGQQLYTQHRTNTGGTSNNHLITWNGDSNSAIQAICVYGNDAEKELLQYGVQLTGISVANGADTNRSDTSPPVNQSTLAAAGSSTNR